MNPDTQSHNTKGKPSQPEPIAVVDAKPKSILVKTLTFTDAHPMFDARRSISSETQANKGLVIIEFIPSLRHHRIERHSTGGPPKIQMVHETAVAGWEPL
jgi:hypothetical protein